MWEFLDLCKQSCDGSGHSLAPSSLSEINKTPDSIAVTFGDVRGNAQAFHLTSCIDRDTFNESSGKQEPSRLEQVHELIENQSTEVQDSDISTVPETPDSVVLETPPDFYSSDASTIPATPSILLETQSGFYSRLNSDHGSRNTEDVIGLQIPVDEVPDSLRKATIELAKKYFLFDRE
ncbi:hypothetical protein KIN20_034033 [Parelaphostrongylus tenuis]|uniref:Uncharacterized protein n=1 Tax=Parelaphostrongylus tenuis TaxID=148309 RepID=A0AAD5R8V9_PARTN|nr:hypothetical protein KIN20_034033 [Parelaphostrongylus tenuis]